MPHSREVGVRVPRVATVIIDHMAGKKEPVPLKEIIALVKSERSDLLSKDVGATVRSIIYRDKRFVKIAQGLYYYSQEAG